MLKMDLGLDLLVLLSNVAPLDKSLLLSIMRDGEGGERARFSPRPTLQHTQGKYCKISVKYRCA